MATIIERRKRGEKIYAFNIDQKNSEKQAHKNINFDKINKGFYDELLDCHDKIKLDTIKLAKSKTKSFKESVYSNKKIPDTWMNKESYYSELYGTMDKDKFFVSYLGKGKEIDDKDLRQSYDFKKNYKLENLDDFESKDFLVKGFVSLKDKINKSMAINKKKINPVKQFIMNKEKKNAINDILEEYEKKYPIHLPSIIVRKEPTLIHGLKDFLLEEEKFEKKEKKEENENENEIIHNNNNFITGNLNNENNENTDNKGIENNNIELNTNSNLNNDNLNKENQETTNSISNKSTSKNEMKKKPEQEKKDVFKTTLFNNMLPYRDNKIKYNNKPMIKMDINNFESPFLHSTTAEFNRMIEITNPKINEKLSSIQYWGPYFSHCPPCRNKSLNFYQTMETNQCLTLLDYLRKVRNSKNVIK